MLFCAISASSGRSPTLPPRNMFTPGTALPSFLAGAPIRPMSPTCACPHEFGQPVQWMRTRLGMSSFASKALAISTAWFFVSTSPKEQNWAPVQVTSPRLRLPASTGNFWKKGIVCISSRSSFFTLGKMKFCSTVMRTSPAQYLSATSAAIRTSSGNRRPAGTTTPTQLRPSCFCAWMPIRSRFSQTSSGSGTASKVSTAGSSLASSATTPARKASTPICSMRIIMRVFWRSFTRWPLSRK
mmetsp:Transcript_35128/g.55064  ORF Transcript_35128/g.55064 Transcript_35128/m.55064 type:complete len:241 (-) Transcript_35128:386-1108(-)